MSKKPKKEEQQSHNRVGSPKYETPEELQDKIDEYFNKGVAQRKVLVGPPNNRSVEYIPVPTITGLCLYCGYDSRQSFYDLEKNERFSYTIKKARTRIEREYEEQLQCGGGAGAIFALKNFGWKDKLEIDTGEIFKGKLGIMPDKEQITEETIKEFVN